MKRTVGSLIGIYIFFASWTEAYKINDYLKLPYLALIGLSSCYLVIILLSGKISIRIIKIEDWLLYISLTAMIFSFAINGGNQNYLVAYFFAFFVCYLLFKIAMFECLKIDKAMKINAYAVLFVAFFVNIEFWLHYFYNFNIREILMFGHVNKSTYLGIYNRAYGFSTEPTNLGFYFNTLGLLGLKYFSDKLYTNRIVKYFIFLLIISAWVFTFSASTFTGMILGLIFVYLINKRTFEKATYSSIIQFTFLLLFAFIFLMACQIGILNVDISPILTKVSLVGQSAQEYSRINLWIRDLERFSMRPIFGYGPGTTTIFFGGSSVNWYLTLINENGLIAGIPLIIFLLVILAKMINSRNYYRNYFLVSYIASLIHLATISTFYDPSFWILVVLFYVCNEKHVIQLEQDNMILDKNEMLNSQNGRFTIKSLLN